MDYKMYKGSIPANQNVIPLIKESLKQDGIKIGGPLRFVGFEASPGVKFYLNGTTESDLMEVPSCGSFITHLMESAAPEFTILLLRIVLMVLFITLFKR